MNSDAKNSIFSQIDVLVVKHGFIRLRVKVHPAVIESIWEGSPKNGIFDADLTVGDLSILQFLVDGLEIGRQQFGVLSFLVIVNQGFHIVS